MACNRPLTGWYSRVPNPETGRYPMVFSPSSADLDRPLSAPCGKCPGCLSDQAMMWSIRCYHEASLHERNSFLTLTYSEAPDVLSKRDMQLFFKRVRKECRLRYFACGEYGTVTRRPHYHALIFGEDFLAGAEQISSDFYVNEWLSKTWGHGFVQIAPVNMATCCYVAGYVNKKVDDPDSFRLMSMRPGIGRGWIDRYSDSVRRMNCVVIEGKELPVPKQYFNWHEDDLQTVKEHKFNYARSNNKPYDSSGGRSKDANILSRLSIRSGDL